jgi:predicted house-cleaning noncanonical NTP pyrophosphatase (MazG superfamily)
MTYKIVRGGVPLDIAKVGERALVRPAADDEEFRALLCSALVAESAMAAMRHSRFGDRATEQRLDDLAEVLEIIRTLAELDGSTMEALEMIRQAKVRLDGDYSQRTVWLGTLA